MYNITNLHKFQSLFFKLVIFSCSFFALSCHQEEFALDISLAYNLDLSPTSSWNTISVTAASKAFLLYLQEAGDFICGKNYFTAREGFASYLIKYTVSGCGLLEYQGQQYTIPAGHAFWIDCRKRQHYYTDPNTGHWHTVWVHFYGANAQFFYELFQRQNNGSPVIALPSDTSVMSTMFSLLKNSGTTTHQQQQDLQNANLLHQLISECVLSSMTVDQSQLIPSTMQSIQLYLLEHFQEKITLEELGNRFNLNPFYLQKQFKRYVGQSPSEYLIYLRIAKAKELIRTTDKSVSQISHEVGIDNPGYFTRLFRKLEGITPHEYNKLWPNIQKDVQFLSPPIPLE